MLKKKTTVLESLKLAETLLGEVKKYQVKNKAYYILKRSMGLELSGADRKKPSDFFPQYTKKEKKNE